MTQNAFIEPGPRNKDLRGRRFGMLVVLGLVSRNRGRPIWRCLCDCGAVADKGGTNLLSDHTKSCGCNSGGPLPLGEASFNKLHGRYVRVARQRSLAFDLTKDEFRALTQGICTYCGAPPAQVTRGNERGDFIYNGVDRVDNSIGYTTANSVTCCSTCNDMKGTLNGGAFIARVRAIAAFVGGV